MTYGEEPFVILRREVYDRMVSRIDETSDYEHYVDLVRKYEDVTMKSITQLPPAVEMALLMVKHEVRT